MNFIMSMSRSKTSVFLSILFLLLTLLISVKIAHADPYGYSTDCTELSILGNVSGFVHQYDLSTGCDISTASFSTSTLDTVGVPIPSATIFNNDGTKLYVLSADQAGDVNEYNLSTPYDASTASFSQIALDVSGQDSSPEDLLFNDDGSILYVLGRSGRDINAYDLSSAYDISTATFDESILSILFQENSPTSMMFNDDGSVLYVMGYAGDDINEYTLSTPYDISSASFDSVALDVSGQETSPQDMLFNDDGSVLYVMGYTGRDINKYDLSTPYDISSATFDDVVLDVSGQETIPVDILFNGDGSVLYVTGTTGDDMNEYTLSTPYDISSASFDSIALGLAGPGTQPISMLFNDNGSILYVLDYSIDAISEYTLSTEYNISTATFDSTALDVSGQETFPTSILFNNDGTILYLIGSTNQDIYEYDLSTPYDISSATFDDVALDVSSQETAPFDLLFNDDGTSLYVLGANGDDISEYTLSTPYDISSATYDDVALDISGQESNPYDMMFNANGTVLYVLGGQDDDVNAYDLSTPYDISTATFDEIVVDFSDKEENPRTMIFSGDPDEDAPTVSTLSPADNATGVSPSTNLVITFNESVSAETGNITIYKTSDDSSVESFDVTSDISGSGSITITVDPSSNLDVSTEYYVIVDPTAFDDLAGNSFAGITASTTWSFTTGSTTDSTDPTVSTLSPTDNATGVSVSSNLIITFDEDVNVETGSTTIYKASDDSVFEIIGITGARVTGDGTDTITINPTNNLAASTEYYVIVDPTAFDDLAGNSFAGITASTTWSFTTESNPFAPDADCLALYVMGTGGDVHKYSLSTSCDVSSGSFDRTISVALQDNQPTDLMFNDDGTKLYMLGVSGADISEYSLSTPYHIASLSFNQIVLDVSSQVDFPSDMMFNDDGTILYVLDRTSDDIFEYILSSAYDISTATYDSVALDVSDKETNPTSMMFNDDGTALYVIGYTGKDINEYTLSTPYDISTATYDSVALDVSSQGTYPFGMLFNDDGLTLYVLDQYEEFDDNDAEVNEYTLSTPYDISSASFNQIALDVSGEEEITLGMFFGGLEDSDVPTVSTYSPSQGATNVSTTANLVLTFNEIVDVESGSVTIYEQRDDSIAETMSITDSKVTGAGTNTITINPSITLEQGLTYYVQISSTALDDSSGNSYGGISDTTTWVFTTEAAAVVSGGGGGGGSSSRRVSDVDNSNNINTLNSAVQNNTPSNTDSNNIPSVIPNSTRDVVQKYKQDILLIQNILDLTLPPEVLEILNSPDNNGAPSGTPGDSSPSGDGPSLPSNRDLQINDSGEDIRQLQKTLNSLGYTLATQGPGSPGNETTIFGPLTRQALIQYQLDNNISPAAGYYGPVTRGVMFGELPER